MYTKERDSDILIPSAYVPWSKKKAKNFKWIEDVANFYEFFDKNTNRKNLIKKFKFNYDLYQGKGDIKHYIQQASPFEMEMINYKQDYDYSKTRHLSIIDTVAKSIVGEQKRRRLNAVVFNSNPASINQRKRKKIELLQGYIDATIINPIREQVTQQYFQANNIENPDSLTAQQQTQANSEIEQKTTQMTPKEILEYMRKDYRSVEDKQLSTLYEYLKYKENIKYKLDQGFEHGVITAIECYHTEIINGEPRLNVVNPINLNYELSKDKMNIQDAEWITYETNPTISEIVNDYKLTRKQIEKLYRLNNFSSGSGYESFENHLSAKMISVVEEFPEVQNINPNTKEGQDQIMHLKYGSSNKDFNIRMLHILFRSVRKIYVVERYDEQTGKTVKHMFNENYKRKLNDVKVTERFVPEIYQVKKVGYGDDAIYLDKGPLPNQHRSIHNPFDVKMPFIGVEYSKLHGNSTNTSVMDLGKPWQFRFNVEMSRLDETLGTDIGNVFLMNMAAVPKNWDLEKFHQYIRYKKIAPLDFSQEGIGPFDANVFKSVDMSNSRKIQEIIGFLEYLKNQVAYSMSYNPSRLGTSIPSMPVNNNKQNIIQSTLQTEGLYTTHNIVINEVLSAFMNTARIAYMNNPIKASYILDDMSAAELEIDDKILSRCEIGLFVVNESEESENLQISKELLQPMIQNGVIQGPDVLKLIWAKSGTEVLDIADRATEAAARSQQEQEKMAQEMMKMQNQLQAQLEEQKQSFELLKQSKEHENSKFLEAIRATQFAAQYDINLNNENDGNERAREQIEFDREELDKKIKAEKELLAQKIKGDKEIASMKTSKNT